MCTCKTLNWLRNLNKSIRNVGLPVTSSYYSVKVNQRISLNKNQSKISKFEDKKVNK